MLTGFMNFFHSAAISWLTVAWSMTAAACFTLAFVHLGTWLRQRPDRARLWFSLAAIGAGGNAVVELLMLHAQTVEQYAWALRASHAPLALMLISIVWFVRSYFGTGRRWLAWTITASWVFLLGLNIFLPFSSVYSEIIGLNRDGRFLGEPFSVARGVGSTWELFTAIFGAGFLVAFVTDASIAAWRNEDRRRALVIGGSMIFFLLAGNAQAFVVDAGLLKIPYMISFAFLAIVLAMGFELSADVARASRLAQELKESEQRMSLAAHAAKLGLWVWEMATDEIWTTDQGRELFGFSRMERLNLARFLGSLHPGDREVVREEIARSLSDGGEYESQHRVLLGNGQTRWIEALGRVEFGVDGRPLRMRGVSRDITRQRQTEGTLQQQRGELAHLTRVAMISELSGSLAHELNQPLSAILTNAQAAQLFLEHHRVKMPELDEMLNDIVEADQRAGEVIRRLRLLLRKGEVQMQPIDVNECARNVLKLLRSDLVSQNVAVQVDFATELPPVIGDSVQIQQILLNLVANACDAMQDISNGNRRLTVRTGAENGSGQVRVDVIDSGRGLPNGDSQEIFKPFFTTRSAGMGLGLSVCHTIISAHGGLIGAENNEGHGAKVYFTLPKANSTTSE
jgi:two-component system, LuxR family, sensor kinase FixL